MVYGWECVVYGCMECVPGYHTCSFRTTFSSCRCMDCSLPSPFTAAAQTRTHRERVRLLRGFRYLWLQAVVNYNFYIGELVHALCVRALCRLCRIVQLSS